MQLICVVSTSPDGLVPKVTNKSLKREYTGKIASNARAHAMMMISGDAPPFIMRHIKTK
jgi:hypothetical protein